MNHQRAKERQRERRRFHVRAKIVGTPERPRLTVHRSSKNIYAQLVDDLGGVTLAAASSVGADVKKDLPYGGNVKAAKVVGQKLAEAAKAKGIVKAAFDRGHYRYHGRIQALAEAANAAGLKCTESKPGKKKKAPAAPAQAKDKKEKKEKKEPKEQKKESAGKPAEAAK